MSQVMARASFSRMMYYKNCPLAYKFKYIDKIAPLERPQKKDKKGNPLPHANERGSMIHEAMDDYINDRRQDIIPELLDIQDNIVWAKDIMQKIPERVSTEQKWYFDPDWNPIEHDDPNTHPVDYQALIIIDLMVFNEDFNAADVIDLKSGKRAYNEQKHAKQLQFYSVGAVKKFPILENLNTQLWYCDLGLIHPKKLTRFQASNFTRYWEELMDEMATDITFTPRSNRYSCRFCEYGPKEHSNQWVNKTGDCSCGVA